MPSLQEHNNARGPRTIYSLRSKTSTYKLITRAFWRVKVWSDRDSAGTSRKATESFFLRCPIGRYDLIVLPWSANGPGRLIFSAICKFTVRCYIDPFYCSNGRGRPSWLYYTHIYTSKNYQKNNILRVQRAFFTDDAMKEKPCRRRTAAAVQITIGYRSRIKYLFLRN